MLLKNISIDKYVTGNVILFHHIFLLNLWLWLEIYIHIINIYIRKMYLKNDYCLETSSNNVDGRQLFIF